MLSTNACLWQTGVTVSVSIVTTCMGSLPVFMAQLSGFAMGLLDAVKSCSGMALGDSRIAADATENGAFRAGMLVLLC